jgi:hypothetical protein
MPPRHALDLLTAFRMDVTSVARTGAKSSTIAAMAMPVGLLDVHGEHVDLAGVGCAMRGPAGQQPPDCEDFLTSIAVLPRDALAAGSWSRTRRRKSSPQMLQCLHALAVRTETHWRGQGAGAPGQDRSPRGLRHQAFADKIVAMLKVRDP